MKKILFTVACLFTILGTQAQVVQSDFDATDSELTTTEQKGNQKSSGGNFDVRLPADGVFGYSLHYTFFDYINIGYFQDLLKTDGLESNSDVGAFAGGSYRYWAMPALFIEGHAGLGWLYHSWSYKYTNYNIIGGRTYTTELTASDHKSYMFAYFHPRVGVKVYEKGNTAWCITAGYRFDAMDFKTDKENLAKYFTFGFAVAF
ncbi:MAG: hypothetical protein IJT28_04000 [Bacteroidaceae bacterium]|nr:hypothetical protein [Bacteroidaceae bacterium]